jgi:hypothetical protein
MPLFKRLTITNPLMTPSEARIQQEDFKACKSLKIRFSHDEFIANMDGHDAVVGLRYCQQMPATARR